MCSLQKTPKLQISLRGKIKITRNLTQDSVAQLVGVSSSKQKGYGFCPRLGAHERQPNDVSLSH